jgi:hypothetical protein
MRPVIARALAVVVLLATFAVAATAGPAFAGSQGVPPGGGPTPTLGPGQCAWYYIPYPYTPSTGATDVLLLKGTTGGTEWETHPVTYTPPSRCANLSA